MQMIKQGTVNVDTPESKYHVELEAKIAELEGIIATLSYRNATLEAQSNGGCTKSKQASVERKKTPVPSYWANYCDVFGIYYEGQQ